MRKLSAVLVLGLFAVLVGVSPVSAQVINGQARTIASTLFRACTANEFLVKDTSQPYGVACADASDAGASLFVDSDTIDVTEDPADTFTFSIPTTATPQVAGFGVGTPGVSGRLTTPLIQADGTGALTIRTDPTNIGILLFLADGQVDLGNQSIALNLYADGALDLNSSPYGQSLLYNSDTTLSLSGAPGGIYFNLADTTFASSGPILPFSNNSTDFGASGTAWKDGYFGGSVSAASYTANGEAGFSGATCTEFTGGLCTAGTP